MSHDTCVGDRGEGVGEDGFLLVGYRHARDVLLDEDLDELDAAVYLSVIRHQFVLHYDEDIVDVFSEVRDTNPELEGFIYGSRQALTRDDLRQRVRELPTLLL